jgi:hypothetical protein
MEGSETSDEDGRNEISEILENLSSRLRETYVREISSSRESYAMYLGIYFE